MRFSRLRFLALIFMSVALCQQDSAPRPQGSGPAAQAPVLNYKLVEWPTQATSAAGFPAGPWNFIQVASVAATAAGNILVLHRGAHPIMEFGQDGKFLRSWGDEMISEGKVAAIPETHWVPGISRYSAVYGPAGCACCGAHAVHVDPQGNIWVVDAGGHVVYKMNPSGKEIMRLGTRGVSGAGPRNFNLPTDVAFAPNGDIYVSDGYGSARVVKFSPEGKFLLEWGKRGTGPGEFGLPHNVAVDAQGVVYVSDRDNQRIQVFDSHGKFLRQWADTGGISALAVTGDQRIWTGTVLRDLDGKIIGRLPGATGGHGGIALPASGDVYIAQLSGIVQKFVKQ
jgi:DNA-binding beta-propeller fold protein YncE